MRIYLLAAVCCLAPFAALAQQKDPAFEVYATTGGYYHGNDSAARGWKPQVGGGVLLPVGRNWAALVDFTTSEAENFWDIPGPPEGRQGQIRELAFTFAPSFIRIWRWDRFSFYGGGGVAMQHRRQLSLGIPIEGVDEDGAPIYGDEPVSVRFNRTNAALLLRSGALVSLTDKWVFRADYSVLPRYIDETASQSVTIGIGYRFGR